MFAVGSKLTKWGNGRGILLPKEICDGLSLSIGDSVSLIFDEKTNTVKLENPNDYTLRALMKGYTGPKPEEIDIPDESLGKELW